MLYSPKQGQKDSLLTDMLAVRERLDKPCKWVKGAFQRQDSLCIVAACAEITGQGMTFNSLRGEELTEDQVRFGRLILFIHEALFGSEASAKITAYRAQARIATANDSPQMTHAAVLLLLDRAIASVVAA